MADKGNAFIISSCKVVGEDDDDDDGDAVVASMM